MVRSIVGFLVVAWVGMRVGMAGEREALLIQAAREGDAAVVHKLLVKGISPDVTDKKGRSALFWASSGDHAKTVRELVEGGAHVNASAPDGTTPLMRTAEFSRTADAARLLVGAGADLQAKNKAGWTSLLLAIRAGHDETALFLLAQGADARAKEPGGSNALALARKYDRDRIVRSLESDTNTNSVVIIVAPAVAKDSGEGGLTVARTGNTTTYSGSAVSPNKAAGGAGAGSSTAKASETVPNSHVSPLANTARPLSNETATSSYDNPTAASSKAERIARIKTLPLGGKDVDAAYKNGRTWLIRAAAEGNMEETALLLGKGARVDVKDDGGWTALMHAAYHGNKEIALALINSGADVNAKASDNRTPLLAAVQQEHGDIVELLLEHKAYPNARDSRGKNALNYALEKGHVTIGFALKKYGAEE